VTGGNRKRKYLRVLTCKHLDPPATPPTLPKNLIQNPLVVILCPISDTFLITVIYIFLKKGKWLVTACEKKKKKPIMAIYWIPNIYIYIYIYIYIINFIRVVNLKFYLCMALRFFPIISYHLSTASTNGSLNNILIILYDFQNVLIFFI
jgi:hypothetical protein